MALSKGVATALAQTSAFAPVYFAVTVTEGGTISGNWVMGNVNKDNTPNRVIIIEMTSDKTGLFIKVSSMIELVDG